LTAYQLQRRDESTVKKLFVTDLDGTLLNDCRQIDPRDLATLIRLRRMGVPIAIATGRSDYSFHKLLTQLDHTGQGNGFPADHIIFSTGAGIMDFPSGRLLKSYALAPDEVPVIAGALDRLALDYMIHKAVPDTRSFLYRRQGGNNPDFDRRLDLYRDCATPCHPELLGKAGRATEVLCIVPKENGHAVADHLAMILKQFSVIKATSPLDGQSIWIEIFAPAVSKCQAVQWLAGEIGIDREHICAVGNDYNDEDLLHWAGKSFVMANSPTPMLARFQSVASNNDGGVSEAVTRWLAL
jgi:hypothetical protein